MQWTKGPSVFVVQEAEDAFASEQRVTYRRSASLGWAGVAVCAAVVLAYGEAAQSSPTSTCSGLGSVIDEAGPKFSWEARDACA